MANQPPQHRGNRTIGPDPYNLRPVWLTDKPIETVEITQKGETFKGTETSRSSLARFIADIVKNPDSHRNENLGISQPNTDGDRPAAYR